MTADIVAVCPQCEGFIRFNTPYVRVDGHLYHLHCGMKRPLRKPLSEEEKQSIARRVEGHN